VLTLATVGVLSGARPLPVPFRSRDVGKVMRFLCAVWLRQDEEVVADPGPSVRPGLLGSAGPQSFGPSTASVLRVTWPAN
jgi:hypothetical protein